ncbi:unnamed protein product [Effrenium voratum]|nr:unnamed protein product [Effrenium voratum]
MAAYAADKGDAPQTSQSLHSMVLLLSLGSWLLLFMVEFAASLSEGEELLHPDRLAAYLASAGFAVVTCVLLLVWCAQKSRRASYCSVIPAEGKDSAAREWGPLVCLYAIQGTMVLGTICWIGFHSIHLQRQQVWRGVLTLYSLLSLAFTCAQRRALREFADGPVPLFLDFEISRTKSKQSSSLQSVSPKTNRARTKRWRSLFQDPSFGGEVAHSEGEGTEGVGAEGAEQESRCQSGRPRWRSFVFEEQAEAVLSATSPRNGWTLPSTYQKNLTKLRGVARRASCESVEESVARRSSFASSAEGDSSFPISPSSNSNPFRTLRTQSQISGFSDVSDVVSPTAFALTRSFSKESRKISKDGRRDSRNSTGSDGALSDVSDGWHDATAVCAVAPALASVEEEPSRADRSSGSKARLEEDRPPPPGLGHVVKLPLLPLPDGAGAAPALDTERTVNSDCVDGILRELHIPPEGRSDLDSV